MKYVIRDWGFGTADESQMLKVADVNYRPDGRAIYPCGFALWTKNVDEAMKFDSPVEAWEFWKQQSTLVPLRPDGEPNRPLTFFSVSVEPLETNELV